MQTSDAVVVYKPGKGRKERKKKRKERKQNVPREQVSIITKRKRPKKQKQKNRVYSDDVAQYRNAIANPFSPSAIGVRVPDSYCFPTVTYHYRTSMVVTSGAAGKASGVILPSPCYSYISNDGTVSGLTAFAQNANAYYCLTPTEMASKLTEYRVVSWGVRFLAKDTAYNSKGKISVALVPTTANAPSWNTLQTITATTIGVVSEYTVGLDTGYLDTSIQSLPSVRVFSMQDLLRGEVQVTGLPLSNTFYDFKGTTDRSGLMWATNTLLADEAVFSTAASPYGLINSTAGGRKDIASLRGGMAIVYYATGLPASVNEFDIELVYHLEGSPNISGPGGSVTGLIPSSQQVLRGSTTLVENIVAGVRTAVPFVRMLTNSLSVDGMTRGIAQLALQNSPLPRLM